MPGTQRNTRFRDSVGTDSPDDTVKPLENRAVFLLSQIGHHVATSFSQRLAPLKIQPRHFAVMNGLAADEGATQQKLADTLGIHRNVMVGIVDDLERFAYAKRESHPGDRRAHAVRLTALGRKVLKLAHVTANALESDVTKLLPASEQAKFLGSLQHLAQSLALEPGSHPSLRDSS